MVDGMGTDPIVVVGGGLAGGRLASEYRAAGGTTGVVVLASEPDPPYNRPPLTKGFLRGELERDAIFVRPLAEYEDDAVELRLATTVTALHPDEHEVELESGERVRYGALVLATGARPRMLPLPGVELEGVHTYRTVADADAVRRAAAEADAAIVIGGSFIGSEAAASLRLRGLEVSIVEVGDTLMPQLRAPDLSAELVELYRVQGIEVLLGAKLEELTGEGGTVTGARLADGRALNGQLVIVGVGVIPNTELAESAGAVVDNGIVVNERFETSLPDVYAIGDVARYPDATSGRVRRIEHWSAASSQGTHLARQLAGADGSYDDLPVFFTQLFAYKLQVLGDLEPATQFVQHGSLAEGSVLGLHLTPENRLVGAVVHGQEPAVVSRLTGLLRERAVIDDPTGLLARDLTPGDAVG